MRMRASAGETSRWATLPPSARDVRGPRSLILGPRTAIGRLQHPQLVLCGEVPPLGRRVWIRPPRHVRAYPNRIVPTLDVSLSPPSSVSLAPPRSADYHLHSGLTSPLGHVQLDTEGPFRETMHQFGFCSLTRSPWARAYYDAKRTQGQGTRRGPALSGVHLAAHHPRHVDARNPLRRGAVRHRPLCPRCAGGMT